MRRTIDATFRVSLDDDSLEAVADGTGVDCLGYNAVTAHLTVGAQTGTSITLQIQESDDNSTFTAVADADLRDPEGTSHAQVAAITTANDNDVYERRYFGTKRYLRWSCTAETTGILAGVVGGFILGHAAHGPASPA